MDLKDQFLDTQKQLEEAKVKEQKYNALKGKVSFAYLKHKIIKLSQNWESGIRLYITKHGFCDQFMLSY